jgi:hypothetical protein
MKQIAQGDGIKRAPATSGGGWGAGYLIKRLDNCVGLELDPAMIAEPQAADVANGVGLELAVSLTVKLEMLIAAEAAERLLGLQNDRHRALQKKGMHILYHTRRLKVNISALVARRRWWVWAKIFELFCDEVV